MEDLEKYQEIPDQCVNHHRCGNQEERNGKDIIFIVPNPVQRDDKNKRNIKHCGSNLAIPLGAARAFLLFKQYAARDNHGQLFDNKNN